MYFSIHTRIQSIIQLATAKKLLIHSINKAPFISRISVSNYSNHVYHNDVTTDLTAGDIVESLTQPLQEVKQQRQPLTQRSEHSVVSIDGLFCSLGFALKLRESINSLNTLEHQLVNKIIILFDRMCCVAAMIVVLMLVVIV